MLVNELFQRQSFRNKLVSLFGHEIKPLKITQRRTRENNAFHRLRDRKTRWSTLSGLRHDLLHVTMLPQALKTRSDGELVAAGIIK